MRLLRLCIVNLLLTSAVLAGTDVTSPGLPGSLRTGKAYLPFQYQYQGPIDQFQSTFSSSGQRYHSAIRQNLDPNQNVTRIEDFVDFAGASFFWFASHGNKDRMIVEHWPDTQAGRAAWQARKAEVFATYDHVPLDPNLGEVAARRATVGSGQGVQVRWVIEITRNFVANRVNPSNNIVLLSACESSPFAEQFHASGAGRALGWEVACDILHFILLERSIFTRMNGKEGIAARKLSVAIDGAPASLVSLGVSDFTLCPAIIDHDAPAAISGGEVITFTSDTRLDPGYRPEIDFWGLCYDANGVGHFLKCSTPEWVPGSDYTQFRTTIIAPTASCPCAVPMIEWWITVQARAANGAPIDGNTCPAPSPCPPATANGVLNAAGRSGDWFLVEGAPGGPYWPDWCHCP